MTPTAQNGTTATTPVLLAEAVATHPPNAGDLARALARVRDLSAQVDGGRAWSAIRTALERPGTAAIDTRLQAIETEVQRVLSVVSTPAPPMATYIGDGLVLMPTSLGFPLIGFSDDLQLTPALLMSRHWDTPTTHLLERILGAGDSFLDIGANIGYFTVFGAALVGFNGRVHAFEPNPRTFDLLSRNVRLNNIGHVCTLHPAAVADTIGDRTLNTFRRNQASSTFAELPERLLALWHERPQTQAVVSTTLDAAFADGGAAFSCMKIDAEGSEGLLWAGGERFFRDRVDDRTIILLEWNPSALRGTGTDLNGLMAQFIGQGFSVWRRDDQLKAARVTSVADLDDWCLSELILARDPSRVASVCP